MSAKEIYEIGEIPPIGTVPKQMYAQVVRQDRYGTPDKAFQVEMIHYDRPERDGVRASDYTVTPVRDGEDGACLVPKTPPLVVVRKRREVLLLDNVRIHLDAVEGLGTFLELEAVVDGAHDDDRCRAQVDWILRHLGVRQGDLIRASYSDLLRRGASSA